MSASRTLRLLTLLLLVAATVLLAAGCGGDDSDGGSDGGDGRAETSEDDDSDDAEGGGVSEDVAARDGKYDAPPTEQLDPKQDYTVRLTTTKGTFDIDVDPSAAPRAAANFVFLVREGFYDGVPFHRVIEGFMVQTGDPTGTGTGGPGYALEDDPVKGTYARGTVAMANAGPDTGGSQFFIVHGPQAADLPKDYVIFGSVDKAGMKVVDEIASVEVEAGPSGEPSTPTETILIERAELVEA